MLAAVPVLIDQLQIAVSKQAKAGGGNGKAGKGSAHERSPVNWGAAAVRDALLVELLTWVADVSNGTWTPAVDEIVVARAKSQPYMGPFHVQCGHSSCERMRVSWVDVAPPLAEQAAAWLTGSTDALRKHPAAAEMLSGVGRAVKDAYRAIDRMQDRKYLGKCMNTVDGVTCHAELWARPTAGELRCRECGYEHNVANRRLDMLDMARDLIVTPREAARYIGEVGGIGIGEQRIRNYVDRKRITARPSSDGAMKIRLGDLLVVILDDGERRTA
jgi:hypothetical protein